MRDEMSASDVNLYSHGSIAVTYVFLTWGE